MLLNHVCVYSLGSIQDINACIQEGHIKLIKSDGKECQTQFYSVLQLAAILDSLSGTGTVNLSAKTFILLEIPEKCFHKQIEQNKHFQFDNMKCFLSICCFKKGDQKRLPSKTVKKKKTDFCTVLCFALRIHNVAKYVWLLGMIEQVGHHLLSVFL